MDQIAHRVGSSVEDALKSIFGVVAKLPGSTYIGNYILKSHQNDPARTLFEILLFLFALRYFFASKQSYSKRNYVKLSDAEVDELISEWKPEPLVKPLNEEEEMLLSEIPILESVESCYVTTKQHENTKLLNMSSTDIFGNSTDEGVKKLAIEKMKYCGVGSCGPAGFYGNEDVHVDCENKIAEFLGTEGAILYSQGVSTAPSVIPCFAKRGDYLVVDDAVSMPIQLGLQLSRAKVLYYAHNDMEDLEQQLIKAVALHRGNSRLPRRFIITEGLFEYTGNSPDLKRVVELKKRFKFRLILDESWSLGILGSHGRGLCEEQGVDRAEVDVTVGSLATAVGTYGGFCAGSKAIVEHQRIVSLAYTFSATEPPFLAGCTSLVVDRLQKGEYSERIASLKERAKLFTACLSKSREIFLISRPDSPMVIFGINGGTHVDDNDKAVSRLLHNAVLACRSNGLLVSRLGQINERETFGPVNAIKVFLPEALKTSEVKKTAETIINSVKQAVKQAVKQSSA